MKKQIVEILKSLSSEYSKKWTEDELKLKIRNWITVLGDLSPQQLINGLKKALHDTSDFMPSIGKFRAMCISKNGCLSIDDEAIDAWSLLMKNLNSTITPVFKDKAITGTVNNLGGWKPFCASINDVNEPFKRKEFISYYCMNRKMKDKFSYVPDRVGKIFMDGVEKHFYKFVGNFSEDEKIITAAEVKRLESSKKRSLKLLSGEKGGAI